MTTLLHARIAFQGTTPLYDRARLAPVLDVLAQRGFPPAKAGLDEREKKPFTREAVLGRLADPPVPFKQTDLYLWASKPLAYRASLALWERSYVGIQFEPTPPADQWAGIFELADALAAELRPDWGAAGLVFDAREDLKRDFANDEERDVDLMTEGVGLYPKDYNLRGPHGLAPRTYIGPYFVEQLGRDRVESLPLAVEMLPWGGYRVDLAPHPWAAEASALLDGWRRGMAHLGEAKLFPIPDLGRGSVMRWTRGANFQPRR